MEGLEAKQARTSQASKGRLKTSENMQSPQELKGKTQLAHVLSTVRARISKLRAWMLLALVFSIVLVVFSIHRTVAYALTTKSDWVEAPIHHIHRDCNQPEYPTLKGKDGGKICMTTLTDEKQGDWLQKSLKWRNFNNLLDMTWPNKQEYVEKHGYHLFDGSTELDNSRPPSWSKIRAARRLLVEEKCDWVLWLDADTVIMNSDKKIEDFLPSEPGHDFVVTRQKGYSFNAGAWAIRNTDWALEFLDTWWNMKTYVRAKGLSVSGDNDALYNYLKDMDKDYFDAHILVPPRCQFNSVTRWVTPKDAKEFEDNPDLIKEQEWYMHDEYYHEGDFVAHVAGRNNKITTSEELLKYAK